MSTPAQPANPAATTAAPAAAAGGAAPVATAAPNASGSLYVGDLNSDVTEALLFEMFNQVGPVSSIRVCRDAATRRSLGYAYVNFHNVNDAERALDTLNFQNIKDRPCRIMWSHRDPSIRKNTKSNIFIKNLAENIDNKALYDTFSSFGNILSCKVAMDANNQSRGYGFVHYETEEGATRAIEEINGMLMNDKKVYVGLHERRSERQGGGAIRFTNVYVKNIPAGWNSEKFESEFSKFGKITSVALQADAEGNHKGFGFVNFESHEEALKAVEGAKDIATGEEKTLFADRFQKKVERSSHLAKKYADLRREKMERYKNLNLYVKNLEDDSDDAKLRSMFEDFGEITSCVVMKDEKGQSRGFGFVCFANVEDANKALSSMNGKMVGQKPIYVNRAQRKDERRTQLEAQFQANMAGQRIQPMAPVFYTPHGGVMAQHGMVYQQPMMNRNRYPAQHGMRGYPMYPQPMKQRGRGGRPGVPHHARNAGQQKFRHNGRYPREQQQQQQMPVQMPPAVSAPVITQQPALGGELTSSMLANADPAMQKQLLGERLFPMVQKEQPELAGKITGMLLEMETSDVLHLLENQGELHNKIVEALEVLQSHSGEGAGATA